MSAVDDAPKADLDAPKIGIIAMSGLGGTSPKTKAAKIVWWIAFSTFLLFVLYVLAKNFIQ
jgi:hypothetical protein